jgi:hypothetical protein
LPNSDKADVPNAKVVKDGKLGGDVPAKPAPYKRKLSNYLLDRSLQLRYVLLVTILSAVIAGSLGYLINDQRHSASSKIEDDLVELTASDPSLAEFQQQVADDMTSQDHALIYKMIGIGIGLVVILSGYLVIMTHKVAGPLYKTSMYFDRMAEGRLGNVTALRRGDMLQDFFTTFRDAHDSVRARLATDLGVMENAASVLRAKLGKDAIADFDAHLDKRKTALARQEWTASQPVIGSNPKIVVAAAVFWVAYGFLALLAGSRAQLDTVTIVLAVIGAFFLVSGVRVLFGRAGTVNIAGGISLMLALLGAVMMLTHPRDPEGTVRMMVWGQIACLAAAGALAVVGADKYATWATLRGSQKKR